MSRRRGLGSGLDALIPSVPAAADTAVRQVPIDALRENRSQPRTRFDEQALDELAASIREHGLIQPVIVSEDPAGGYELIAGERRWRAARRAGLQTIPVLVKSATPQQLLELALVENVQRADLNPLEEGIAYQTLKDEFGLTDDMIARRVGKSRVAVVNTRRLIRLTPPARQALLEGTLSAGHGRALLRFEDSSEQEQALALVLRQDLSVRETERLGELAHNTELCAGARAALLSGTLGLAQAQALLGIGDPALQGEALDQVLGLGLTVRETEQLTQLVADGLPPTSAVAHVRPNLRQAAVQPLGATARPSRSTSADPGSTREPSPDDVEVRRLFEELLATPVQLSRSAGAIRLTITFFSDEQLQAFYDRLAAE
ncbi:MAG: ParB/RepB/Spo0J family partition protein [Chloroflexi bacterium OHK40]